MDKPEWKINDEAVRGTQPDFRRTSHVLISGLVGIDNIETSVRYLLESGYDDINISYPKDESGHKIIETRLLALTATKIVEYRIEESNDQATRNHP